MDSNWNKHTGLKDPTCALKFVWSSIKLSEGTSASCHRTTYDKIPEGDFGKFHHTHADNIDVIYKPTLLAVGETVLSFIYNI